jgi:hypothetical protein
MAKALYRLGAGKEESDGPSTDEDAPADAAVVMAGPGGSRFTAKGAPSQGGPSPVEAATTPGGGLGQGRVVDLSNLTESPAVNIVKRKLLDSTETSTKRHQAGANVLAGPESTLQGAGAGPLRSVDMHRCWLTIVHTRHWEAYASRLKLVEF